MTRLSSANRVKPLLRITILTLLGVTAVGVNGAQAADDNPTTATSGEAKPHAVHLPPEVLKSFTGKYMMVRPPGSPPPPPGLEPRPTEITADHEGLLITFADEHKYLPVSATEFFDVNRPKARLIFSKNEKGEITGFVNTGIGDPNIMGPDELKFTRIP